VPKARAKRNSHESLVKTIGHYPIDVPRARGANKVLGTCKKLSVSTWTRPKLRIN